MSMNDDNRAGVRLMYLKSVIIIIVVILLFIIATRREPRDVTDQPFNNLVEFKNTNLLEIPKLSNNYKLINKSEALLASPNNSLIYVMDLTKFKVTKTIKLKSTFYSVSFETWEETTAIILDTGVIYLFDNLTQEIIKMIDLKFANPDQIVLYKNYLLLNNYKKLALIDLKNKNLIYDVLLDFIMGEIEVHNDLIVSNLYQNQESNYNIHVMNMLSLKDVWSYADKIRGKGGPRFSVANNVVAYSDHKDLTFFDLYTGKRISRHDVHVYSIDTRNEKFYIYGNLPDFEGLFCMDLSGNIVWRSFPNDPYFIVLSEFIYQRIEEGSLSKINLVDGKTVWSIKNPDITNNLISTNGNYVIVESENQNVYIIDDKTGQLIWRYDVHAVQNQDLLNSEAGDIFWFVSGGQLYIYDGYMLKGFKL